METTLLLILLLLVAGFGAAILWLLLRPAPADERNTLTPLLEQMGQSLQQQQEQLRRLEAVYREEMALSRREGGDLARASRAELAATVKGFGDSVTRQLAKALEMEEQRFGNFSRRLGELTESNEKKLEQLRQTIEQRLEKLQQDNTRKLEEMRKTVDEKLQSTLEKRLGESFNLVSKRLEEVHKGLGEMQTLASGVGDLKRLMTNVKTRGIWGEMQLDLLLEQILTPQQYDRNVATVPGSAARVEFAIRLPGPDDDPDQVVYLPIDAKFPTEDYDRLVQATQLADGEAIQTATRALEVRIRQSAQDICQKYLAAPHTTDFGIMFLPSEGLYAEVVRNIGLVEQIRRESRVIVTGPTTIAALLNSLQMGFRSLAIQKRSSEVWNVLAAVKNEFGKFGGVLERMKKQVTTLSNTIDSATTRTSVMSRRLRDVESMPDAQARATLELDAIDEPVDQVDEKEE